MPLAKDLGPLDWRIAITDKNGRPTPEFQRRWNTQRSNNALIGTITFGSGAPPADPVPDDGALYVDDSGEPYTIYVGEDGEWHKSGVTLFTELTDVPHAYTASGSYIVRVKVDMTGLEFIDPLSLTADPTATAGSVAVNGTASTFMRSDAAPAVQIGSAATFGILKPDGTTILGSGGTISVPVATAAARGISRPDNITITISSGVLTAVFPPIPAGANPTATAGPTAVNGVATTFMRSDAAPAVQLATTTRPGLVQPDGTTVTISGGVISAVGGGGGGGNIFSQALGSATFISNTTAFASKGNLFFPAQNCTLLRVFATLSTITAGTTVRCSVFPCNTAASTITGAAIGSVTLTGLTANSLMTFDFSATPLSLVANQMYVIMLTGTAAALGTTTLGLYSVSTPIRTPYSELASSWLYVVSTGGANTITATNYSAAIASLNPVNGNTIVPNSSQFIMHLEGTIP